MKVVYLVLVHVLAGYVIFGESISVSAQNEAVPAIPKIVSLERYDFQLDELTEDDREQLNELIISLD